MPTLPVLLLVSCSMTLEPDDAPDNDEIVLDMEEVPPPPPPPPPPPAEDDIAAAAGVSRCADRVTLGEYVVCRTAAAREDRSGGRKGGYREYERFSVVLVDTASAPPKRLDSRGYKVPVSQYHPRMTFGTDIDLVIIAIGPDETGLQLTTSYRGMGGPDKQEGATVHTVLRTSKGTLDELATFEIGVDHRPRSPDAPSPGVAVTDTVHEGLFDIRVTRQNGAVDMFHYDGSVYTKVD